VETLFSLWSNRAFGLRTATLTLLAQLPHPRRSAHCQFGVIFRFPGGMFTVQKTQQFAALHFLPGGLQQEGAAPTRAYQVINFLQQISRDYDVRSLCACHMYIMSVP
jgi:hypothetical protein